MGIRARYQSLWHGKVFMFGDEWMQEAMAALEQRCSANLDRIFPLEISERDGLWLWPIAFSCAGFGCFSANDVVTITTSRERVLRVR